jgi:hypothetical protein
MCSEVPLPDNTRPVPNHDQGSQAEAPIYHNNLPAGPHLFSNLRLESFKMPAQLPHRGSQLEDTAQDRPALRATYVLGES